MGKNETVRPDVDSVLNNDSGMPYQTPFPELYGMESVLELGEQKVNWGQGEAIQSSLKGKQ